MYEYSQTNVKNSCFCKSIKVLTVYFGHWIQHWILRVRNAHKGKWDRNCGSLINDIYFNSKYIGQYSYNIC